MNGNTLETNINTNASVVQSGVPSLWKTMFQAVKERDKQKVDDTKEDIDTLLVFAGLFSAVVTTFLVASYPSLQPDNTDEIVSLLRQAFAQNYTITDGVIRPMGSFPVDTAFEVPLWALRVNGLWFASLVVSLSTASFGMLVKQWLIEYLAMEEWVSPEEQLRARHYRYPGLRHWKVFEIAALLPLFLHVSLGLFFLGLSFYTAAANETIGRSTFTLVAGWAFFALVTVFAPLASPRCPYKVSSFKAALRIGRRYVSSHLWTRGRAIINDMTSAARWLWRNVMCLPYRLGSAFMNSLDSLRRSARRMSYFLWLPIWAFSLPFRLLQGAVHVMGYIASDHGTDKLEEEDIMQHQYQMHELLLIADEALVDDSSILETMVGLLRQTRIEPQSTVAFALGCIRNRLSIASNRNKWIPDINGPIQGLLDLRVLSESAWDTLAKLMGEILGPYISNIHVSGDIGADPSHHFIANAAAVLLSRSPWPFPEYVYQLLVSEDALATMLQLIRKRITKWPVRDVFHTVWIAMTVSGRNPGTTARAPEKRWTQLPTRYQTERIITHFQVVVGRIILENAWRKHEESSNHSVEAIQMIAHILGTTLPVADVREHERQLSQSSAHESYLKDVIGTYPDFPQKYSGVADYLGVVVGTSRELLESALSLYSAYFHRSLVPRRHESLWAVIHRIDNLQELLMEDTKPLMLDLWRFLLCCARNRGEHLQTDEFVKLCLALARPKIPLLLGRPKPDEDWEELLPVLDRAADECEDAPLNDSDSTQRDGTSIPALAEHALQRLRVPDSDAPKHPVYVLEELVASAAPPHNPAVSPMRSHSSDHTTRTLPAGGEAKRSTYTDRPRSRGHSATGIARDRPSRSPATEPRGRDPQPQFPSERRAEPISHSRDRGRGPAVTAESSYPPSHDVVHNPRGHAASMAAPPTRPVALSVSSRQSSTAVSTRLSSQAPLPQPVRTHPAQAAAPASAATSTSVGPLSLAGHRNVPPPELFPIARPPAGHVAAAAPSSSRTVPAMTIQSASSVVRPMPVATSSSASGSIFVPLPPGEHSVSPPIGAFRASPAAVASAPAQRLQGARAPGEQPSIVPSRSGSMATGAPSVGARQQPSGSGYTARPAMPAEVVVRDDPRTDAASAASQGMHTPWAAESGGRTRRPQGRSQSVDVDLEAGAMDRPQRAHPHRSRSTSRAPSSYSYARAEP